MSSTTRSSKKRKRRAWSVSEKIQTLKFSESHSDEDTIFHMGCSKRNLDRWKDQKDNLLNMTSTAKRLKGGGNKVKSIEVEEEAKNYLDTNRDKGYPVSGIELQQHVRNFAEDNDLDHKGSNRWLALHKVRNSLVFRNRTTTKSQITSQNKEENQTMFLKLFKMMLSFHKITNPSFVLNVDETSVTYDSPRRTTLDYKGTKDIEFKTSGHEKESVTSILAVSASGEKLSPFVVISGKSQTNEIPKRISVPNEMIVVSQKSAWSDIPVMKLWIEKVLNPWVKSKDGSSFILILDEAASHMNSDIKFYLEELNVHPLYIPAGCTSFLQPLDVSVNRSFKSKLKQKWEEWIKTEALVPTKSGKGFKLPYDDLLARTSECWSELTKEVILNGWRKPGLIPFKKENDKNKTMTPQFKQWLASS